MLTPSFQISQTDEHLIITIHAPYTQLKDVEINALGSEFWFYSSPYFLRLHFPYEVVDDDEPPTNFNADKGEFEIQLCKQEHGQHFPDLDLLSTLLAPRNQQKNIKPSIEVVSDDIEGTVDEDGEEDMDEWLIDQELPTSEPLSILNAPKYGFGNLTQGVFQQLKSEFMEIIDLPDPDITTAVQRRELRKSEEDEKFSSDHYLADFMEPEVVEFCLIYKPPWFSETLATVNLTQDERESLKKLGNKEFLLSKDDKRAAWMSLVDIVFAFAYNHRTTLGENTAESAWTINKLSATLSWFNSYTCLHSVIVTCFRRLLTYSLYRNWELAQLVLRDTVAILRLGRRQVLKCLLEVHSLFTHSEPRYLLNQLYISDYCIWLQKTSEHKLSKLTDALEQVTILKSDVEFDLEEFEQAALLVEQEEKEEEEAATLTNKIKNLKLENCDGRSSCDNSSESGCTSSEDNSSESGCTSSEDSSTSLDSDDDSSPES